MLRRGTTRPMGFIAFLLVSLTLLHVEVHIRSMIDECLAIVEENAKT